MAREKKENSKKGRRDCLLDRKGVKRERRDEEKACTCKDQRQKRFDLHRSPRIWQIQIQCPQLGDFLQDFGRESMAWASPVVRNRWNCSFLSNILLLQNRKGM